MLRARSCELTTGDLLCVIVTDPFVFCLSFASTKMEGRVDGRASGESGLHD